MAEVVGKLDKVDMNLRVCIDGDDDDDDDDDEDDDDDDGDGDGEDQDQELGCHKARIPITRST